MVNKDQINFSDFYESQSDRLGSYSYSCGIKGQRINSFGFFKTKREAKHNAAMWALVFILIEHVPKDYRMPVLVGAIRKIDITKSQPYEP
ncbi:hypothetical protein HZS_1080 [Henneguya salminicola]|nr:hypothetical protein HZS_1080 [Henneguya salminicola]